MAASQFKRTLTLAPAPLLAALLSHWRTTRDDRLTPLITTLGEKLDVSLGDRPDKLKARAEWLADAFEDPTCVAAADAETRAFAEQLASSRTLPTLGPVIRRWLTLDADPRLATLALSLLQTYADATTYGKQLPRLCVMPTTLTKDLVKVLFTHCDPGHPIDAFITQRTREVDESTGPLRPSPSSLAAGLKKARKAHPTRPEWSDAELAALRGVIGAPSAAPAKKQNAATAVSEAALLEAICERPADDGPRAVFADWLLENGRTSYGELIQLQLKAKRTAAEKAREKVLIKESRPEWSRQFGGDAYAVHLPSARVERGFVVDATLRCKANTPVYRLVERARFDGDPIVAGARFDQLTEAREVDVASAGALLSSAPRLHALELRFDISSYRKKPAAPVLTFFKQERHRVSALSCRGSVDDTSQASLVDAVLSSTLASQAKFLSLGVLALPLSATQLAAIPASVEVLHFGRRVDAAVVRWAWARGALYARFDRFVSKEAEARSLLAAQLPAFGALSTLSWAFDGTNLASALAAGLNPRPVMEKRAPAWAQLDHALSLFA